MLAFPELVIEKSNTSGGGGEVFTVMLNWVLVWVFPPPVPVIVNE